MPVHIIKPGETLWGIAQDYGILDWSVIFFHERNMAYRTQHPNPDQLCVGAELYIPEDGPIPRLSPRGERHALTGSTPHSRSQAAPVEAPALVKAQPREAEDLELWAQRGRLFALFDACDLPEVSERAKMLGEGVARSLYQSHPLEAEDALVPHREGYWAIAPYVFQVHAPTLEWILSAFDGQPWGVFVVSDATLDALHLHFRHLLLVSLPSGEIVDFRFYDPRVLQAFLPLCNERELGELYGPVSAFVVTLPELQAFETKSKAKPTPGPEKPLGKGVLVETQLDLRTNQSQEKIHPLVQESI